jgi:AraC-like DNA-binding protein
MEKIFINMENLSKSYYHYPRRFDLVPSVGVIGYVMDKKDLVSHPFESFNFSFIIKGSGMYRHKGMDYRVEAPCVITQWPGEPMHYGADSNWNEIYFIYPAEVGEKLIASGLFNKNRFIWKIHELYEVLKMLDELYELCCMPVESGIVDRIDLLCSKIVMDSLCITKEDVTNSQEKMIRKIADKFRLHPERLYDFAEIAHENDMSVSTFRRLWLKYQKVPPARFLADLKVDAACHLLNGTALSINEIAAELNFSDPLYFSRFFRQKTGFSATEYRNLNKPQ